MRDVQEGKFFDPPWKIDRHVPCYSRTPVMPNQIYPTITKMVDQANQIPV